MLYFHCLNNESNKRIRKFNRMLEKLNTRNGVYVSNAYSGRHVIIRLYYLNMHMPTIHATRFYLGPDHTYTYWGRVGDSYVPRVYYHMSNKFPNAGSISDQQLALCEHMFHVWI
jgi:hypothetical protein